MTFTVVDIFFMCYRCYVFMLPWSDGASDGLNVQALAIPKNYPTQKGIVGLFQVGPTLARELMEL